MRLRQLRTALGLCVLLPLVPACGGGEGGGAPPEAPGASGPSGTAAPGASGPEAAVPAPTPAPTAPGLPAGFPRDAVPVPDAGTVVAALAEEEGGERSFTVTFQVPDAGQAAQAHREALEGAGYGLEDEFSASGEEGSLESYVARRSDWVVNVLASSEPGAGGDTVVVGVVEAGAASGPAAAAPPGP